MTVVDTLLGAIIRRLLSSSTCLIRAMSLRGVSSQARRTCLHRPNIELGCRWGSSLEQALRRRLSHKSAFVGPSVCCRTAAFCDVSVLPLNMGVVGEEAVVVDDSCTDVPLNTPSSGMGWPMTSFS